MIRGWVLDELAHAGRENLDAEHVAQYDRKMDADAAAEVQLLRDLGMDGTSVVLDVGVGTGQFAIAAAAHCRQVIAVDISPVMLSRLEAKVGTSGHENIKCVLGGFLTYEHASQPVNFIYSRYVLHHLPDFWKSIALARMHGLLSPSGVFRLWDVVYHFTISEAPERIERWCASAGTGATSGWNRAEFEEHVRDEHSTYTWLLEPMIEQAGFVISDRTYTDDGTSAKYVLRRR
jgi:ubiquinone/menaquinone biosynthesis C-methylase UbiE